MEQMESEKAVDVYGFVTKMRKQRNFMVQTQVCRKIPKLEWLILVGHKSSMYPSKIYFIKEGLAILSVPSNKCKEVDYSF